MNNQKDQVITSWLVKNWQISLNIFLLQKVFHFSKYFLYHKYKRFLQLKDSFTSFSFSFEKSIIFYHDQLHNWYLPPLSWKRKHPLPTLTSITTKTSSAISRMMTTTLTATLTSPFTKKCSRTQSGPSLTWNQLSTILNSSKIKLYSMLAVELASSASLQVIKKILSTKRS